MQATLKHFTLLFGVVCTAIATGHILFGPSVIPGSIPVNATMDSEDRFYASLFFGFGCAMIWCSKALDQRAGQFACLLAVFFLGGVARIISAVSVGLPSNLFIVLGGLELIMPPVMWFWHKRAFANGAKT